MVLETLRKLFAREAIADAGRVPVRSRSGGGRLRVSSYEAHHEAYPPGGLATLARMQRDAQVRACLTTKRLACLADTVEVHPAGEDARARRAVSIVEARLAALPGGVRGLLDGALDALAMGFSVGEYIWAADGSLARVAWHDPARFTFIGDGFGEVRELELAGTGQRFPRSGFVLFPYQGRYGSPYGESDLAAAYRAWSTKDLMLRYWSVCLDRFGTPTVLAKVPAFMSLGERDDLMAQLITLQNESALIVPETVEISTLEARSGDAGAAFEKALDWQDRQIAKAILGQTLTTEPGASGSYALGQVHAGVFDEWVGALRRQLAETVLTGQIARTIVQMAEGDDAPVPTVTLPRLSADERAARRDLVTQLIAGDVIAPGEAWIRKYLGLPEG